MLGEALGVSVSAGAERAAEQCVEACIGFVVLCFLGSQISGNYSQVDKLWSITPCVYAWIFFAHSEGNPRMLWMATVVTVWGARLTLNFARRGGYRWPPWEGEEDYRWAWVQKLGNAPEHPVLWQLFNLSFICIYQHALLLLLTFPSYTALRNAHVPMDAVDWALGALIVLLVGLEGLADEQQYVFQEEKYRRIRMHGRDKLTGQYRVGFLKTGLFSLCRHPNYACEQAIWIVFALFAVNLARDPLHWTSLGALLLVLLFYPSSVLSEWITVQRYPKYKEYQRTHSRFLPLGQLAK